jgi:hypothetical protein
MYLFYDIYFKLLIKRGQIKAKKNNQYSWHIFEYIIYINLLKTSGNFTYHQV